MFKGFTQDQQRSIYGLNPKLVRRIEQVKVHNHASRISNDDLFG